ncbi:hypothetical protein [Streptomyces sp. NPDC058373]|uniref:hypothetical protein n=1 Tax=Streptomyces sp. NPDC058373 TaxID=3346465 RepID=UPI00364C2790
MAAITLGSVEVDVIPSTQGIYQRLRAGLVPAATRAGEDAGSAAGRAFGPAMRSEVGNIGMSLGQQIGQQIAARITSEVRGALRDGVTQGGAPARAAATRQGDQTGSAFGRSLRTRVEAAVRSLPEIRLDADSTEAEREIHHLRRQLQSITDARIGVDVDAARAVAELERIQVRLRQVSASDADIAVRVDAGAAAAELSAVHSMVNALDRDDVRIRIDTSGAMSAIFQLTVAMGALAAVPAIPVLAAGIGSIASAGVAAGVGVGALAAVAVPAVQGIAGALQAQKAAQDAATSSTSQGGAATSQAASRALQMAGAQQALATAHRNASRQISQAEQAVADAVRSAADANRQAAQQVKQAKQSLADAVQQAADRQRSAAEVVSRAEESLADAQRTARQAQLDLTQARKDAAQELLDLEQQLTNSKLSERDAALSVKEAEERLRAATAEGSRATQLERDRAALSLEQAQQRLKEQQAETKNLTKEKKAADKAGVEGSETVRKAQEQLAKAEQGIVDQQKALGKAREEAARQQVESQKQIATAQERVSESQKNVARTQEDGARSVARAQESLAAAHQSAADSIASAQRQVASASQQAAGGVDQAAAAQARYQAELANLTPAARATFDAFVSLRDAFGEWSESLQPHVMPIFTRALEGIKNSLPGLTPIVIAAAEAISSLQDRVSKGFKSPWWKEFKADLDGAVGPAIEGLGVSFGRVFKGMAGIIQAFFPHMDSISSRMQSITGRFAEWGTSLKGSPEFERFLGYSSEMAPKLGNALREIGGALLNVGQALSPVSGPLLDMVAGVASAIGTIADKAPWAVSLLYGLIVATKLWTLATVAAAAAQRAWAIAVGLFNLAMRMSPIGWVVTLIGVLVAAIVWVATQTTWFQDAWAVAWAAIRDAASWAWRNIIKPALEGLQKALRACGDVAKWLWQKAIKPAMSGIGEAVKVAWKSVVKPALDAFVRGLRTVGDWAKWLRDKAIRPVWNGIRDAISSVYNKGIKPVFEGLKGAVRKVADSFKSARDSIKTAWNKLKDIARKPVQYVVDVVYNNGIRGAWNLIAKAFGATPLPKYTFASGGIMPGYTPGRDVHRFVSPTGGALELSGGEAIMRPEFTRAVGPSFVGAMNSLAKRGGTGAVRDALGPMVGGNPNTPTDRTLKYADGGIFGWIKKAGSAALGAGSAVWNKVKEGASWLGDTLEGSARAGVKHVVDPLLTKFPGMDSGFGRMIRKVPTKIIDSLFGYSKKADDKGAGGIGGPRIQAGLKWARTQHGKRYQWGGNGNPSWDCSGFMSAIESVIRGQKPHRRWATGAFSGRTAPPGWRLREKSPFMVGITNKGVGHTAGTIGKVNVESRGGDGVVVGKRARAYNDRMFSSWYGFKPGTYDSGGYIPPGLNLVNNGTGKPEPVFTTAQANALTRMANARTTASGPATFEGNLYLDSGEFLGRVRGEAEQVMQQGQRQLISIINAS